MDYISNYLAYSRCNEAPEKYHLWSALSCMSHIVGPRVWTHMGGFLSFYPNLYVLLVGDPGTMKTTAMIQAKEMLQHFPQIAHSPASASKEALVKLMSDDDSPCKGKFQGLDGKSQAYSQLALFASEIVSLLNASGNPSAMIEFMTDVWDRPGRQYEQTFIKGKTVIKRPYVSILACLTPSTLAELVNTKVVSTGMSRRCTFIAADRIEDPKAFIVETDEQKAAWQWCIAHGKSLLNVTGEFGWEPEARSFYKQWYDGFKPTVAAVKSEVLRNFYMTKPEYVIKVSMLLSLAKAEPKLIHELSLFKTALELVTDIEKGACDLFDAVGRNELTSVAAEVEKYFRARKGQKLSFTALLREFWGKLKGGDRRELESILQQLGRSGKIKVVTDSFKDDKGNFQQAEFFIYD